MYINICKYICDIYQRNLLQYKQVSYIHGDPWLFCFTLTPDLFVLQAASPFPFGVRKHSERLPLSRRADVRRAIASGGTDAKVDWDSGGQEMEREKIYNFQKYI